MIFLLIGGIIILTVAFVMVFLYAVQKYFVFPGAFIAKVERREALFIDLSFLFRPFNYLYKKLFSENEEENQLENNSDEDETKIEKIEYVFPYEDKYGETFELKYNFQPMNFEISNPRRVLAVFCNGNSDMAPHQRSYYTVDQINKNLDDDKKISDLLTISYPGFNTPTEKLLTKYNLLKFPYDIVKNHINVNGRYDEVIVFGNSIGTVVAPNIAIKIANELKIPVKLVLFRPIASISKLVGDKYSILKYLLSNKLAFDNVKLFDKNSLNEHKPKIFISVGNKDNTTPPGQGRFLAKKLSEQGYEVDLTAADADHFYLDPSFTKVADFINKK